LDVGATSVKVARLEHGPGGATLLGLAIAELDGRGGRPTDGPQVNAKADAIRAALTRSGADPGRSAHVVTAVGGAGVSIKHVAFPRMSRSALAESIHWEARKHVPFGESDFILDFQILDETSPEDNGEMQVLLAAVEAELVDKHIADLAAAGVEPDAVDLVPLALMNEVDEEGLLDGETLAVVDVGVSNINLAIHRRGGLFFSRTVPLLVGRFPGGNHGNAAGTRPPVGGPVGGEGGHAADDGGAWRQVALSEIRRSLTFYNNETGKKGIDRMYLTGGRALVPGIAAELSEELGIATEVLDPLAKVERSASDISHLSAQGPRFALAMGLARRT
jgi:type IV pilus assembly protein PilM